MGLIIDSAFLIQPTIINLHPSKYSQERHYYTLSKTLKKAYFMRM